VSIDTACSSALVATVLGATAVSSNQANGALCGGVQAMSAPFTSISCTGAGMLASDGRCKTFDSRADGFVRAEGCGMVLLRRRSETQVVELAALRGFALNQDGRSSGLTAPNG
jgi:acyl transferase domain-containing protein